MPIVKSDGFSRMLRAIGYGLTILVISCAIAVIGLLLTGYRVGLDAQRLIGKPACMPSLVYLWTKTDGNPPSKGDYIVARMPKTSFGMGGREGDRIVKIIAGVPGDKVRIVGTELWINGEHKDRLWLAKSLPGKSVGDYDVDVVLGERQYFVMGTTQESFDSRYWGPINREAIIGTALPVF
ncbi:peptidase S26 [Diaphorobacter sp. J5-51]|nr:peptidase S26 [Diaphorobacter sp. J5-51]